jgi:hypothetical protein
VTIAFSLRWEGPKEKPSFPGPRKLLSHIRKKQNVCSRFDGDTDGVYLLIVKASDASEMAALEEPLLGGRILIDRVIVKVILDNDIGMNPNLVKILGPFLPDLVQNGQRLIRLEH